MIVLDFLFYYLTYWFDKHKEKLSWSTPLERTVYAIGLITMSWIYALNQLLNHFSILKMEIPIWPYLILALVIMQLYKYIYITKNRFQLLMSSSKTPGNVSTKMGIIISISFVFFSIILPFVLILIFVPFGKHQL